MDLEEVKEYASYMHRKQNYDQYPYTFHLTSVELAVLCYSKILENQIKFDVDKLLKAAWLHDIIEDTTATQQSLINDGVEEEVVSIVFAVTDGEGKNRKERKAKMYEKCKSFPEAIFIKLCDRICNVEHSVKSNSGMTYMYRKEHEEFKKNLHLYSKDMQPMWDYLETLLSR